MNLWELLVLLVECVDGVMVDSLDHVLLCVIIHFQLLHLQGEGLTSYTSAKRQMTFPTFFAEREYDDRMIVSRHDKLYDLVDIILARH